MKLPNSEEKFCYTGTELLNFKFTLPLAKLNIVDARPVPNGLIFQMTFQSIFSKFSVSI